MAELNWRNRKTLVLSRTDMMGLVTPAECGLNIGQGKIAPKEQTRVFAVAEKFRRAFERGPCSGRVTAS